MNKLVLLVYLKFNRRRKKLLSSQFVTTLKQPLCLGENSMKRLGLYPGLEVISNKFVFFIFSHLPPFPVLILPPPTFTFCCRPSQSCLKGVYIDGISTLASVVQETSKRQHLPNFTTVSCETSFICIMKGLLAYLLLVSSMVGQHQAPLSLLFFFSLFLCFFFLLFL